MPRNQLLFITKVQRERLPSIIAEVRIGNGRAARGNRLERAASESRRKKPVQRMIASCRRASELVIDVARLTWKKTRAERTRLDCNHERWLPRATRAFQPLTPNAANDAFNSRARSFALRSHLEMDLSCFQYAKMHSTQWAPRRECRCRSTSLPVRFRFQP